MQRSFFERLLLLSRANDYSHIGDAARPEVSHNTVMPANIGKWEVSYVQSGLEFLVGVEVHEGLARCLSAAASRCMPMTAFLAGSWTLRMSGSGKCSDRAARL